MTRIFFSDVHIGHPENKNSDIFEKFLLDVCSKYDEIVMVGDIFEFWLNDRYTVYKENPAIIEILRRPEIKYKTIYIPGNHDYVHRNIIKFKEICYPVYKFHVKNKIFSVTHGHNQSAEAKMIGYPIFKYIMDKQLVSDLMYKIFSLPQLYPIEWFYKWITQNRCAEIQEELEEGAKKLEGFVIMGHSHIPVIKENYANCGNWLERTDYISMDDDGNIELKSYTANITESDMGE